MALQHKFDKTKYEARKQARERARQNANESSVPELREAVRDLEQVVGVKPAQ